MVILLILLKARIGISLWRLFLFGLGMIIAGTQIVGGAAKVDNLQITPAPFMGALFRIRFSVGLGGGKAIDIGEHQKVGGNCRTARVMA